MEEMDRNTAEDKILDLCYEIMRILDAYDPYNHYLRINITDDMISFTNDFQGRTINFHKKLDQLF